jgi:pentatricopeptide repeat protein
MWTLDSIPDSSHRSSCSSHTVCPNCTPYLHSYSTSSSSQLHNSKHNTNDKTDKNIWVVRNLCRSGDLTTARELYNKDPQPVGATALISSYSTLRSKDGKLSPDLIAAEQVFDTLISKGVAPSIQVIGALLKIYCSSGKRMKALALFDSMRTCYNVTPDQRSFGILTYACAEAGDAELAKILLDKARSQEQDFTLNVIDCTQLMQAFGKALPTPKLHEALNVLEFMDKQRIRPNAQTYTTLLGICADVRALEEGRRVHQHLLNSRVEMNVILSTALISMYGRCGDFSAAYSLFDQHRQFRNIITWNALIAASVQAGNAREALALFEEMKQDKTVVPDDITYACLLSACARLAASEEGKRIHQELKNQRRRLPGYLVAALIAMYAKSNCLNEAVQVFNAARQHQSKNKSSERLEVDAWNAMIAAYGQHGYGKAALALFKEMIGKSGERGEILQHPDEATFVGILNACSHASMADEALAIYNSMQTQFGISPGVVHGTCVVDALGRVGRLEEAEKFKKAMPTEDVVTWTTLLGAARIHKDVQLAERLAEHLIKVDALNAAPRVLLGNTYAVAGRYEESRRVHQERKMLGVKKIPGSSSIQIGGKVHHLTVHDTSHERTDEIYIKLRELYPKMYARGYVPNTSEVLHDLSEHEKQDHLCWHSEKLAIALGLISTPPGTPLTVVKNLRVCPDCHEATKYIALVEQRKISVRDANRWHHFTPDGKCNCGDFW